MQYEILTSTDEVFKLNLLLLIISIGGNMPVRNIYNIGTTVYYCGDESITGGFGKITAQEIDYLGGLELEITLEDGRVIPCVSLGDFEAPIVNGNTGSPEFHLADGDLVEELNQYGDEE